MTLTAEQIEQRRKGITATDLVAIMGLSKYKSPFGVWLEKVHPEMVATEEASKSQERGHWLEPAIAKRWALKHNLVLRPGPMPTMVHPELDWLMMTPDAIGRPAVPKASERLGEIKTWGAPLDPDVCDPRFECQARVQLAVAFPLLKISRCDVVAWAIRHEDEPFEYVIERDESVEKDLIEVARHFWFSYVLPRKEPPPDASDEYARYCNLQPATGQGLEVEATHELCQLANVYQTLQREVSRLEDEKREAANRLRFAMRELDWVKGPFGKLSYSVRKGRSKTDWEQVARMTASAIDASILEPAEKIRIVGLFHELVAQYTKTEPSYRALYPRWAKSEGDENGSQGNGGSE